jgi:hypothetical protein
MVCPPIVARARTVNHTVARPAPAGWADMIRSELTEIRMPPVKAAEAGSLRGKHSERSRPGVVTC